MWTRRILSENEFFDCLEKSCGNMRSERFYHGFVLGLMVNFRDRYLIRSNREMAAKTSECSFGRYDVMPEPQKGHGELSAIILEFKVFNGCSLPRLILRR